MLTITQAGLAAITNADEGGFKINLATFKLSEYDVSGFENSDFANATDMVGDAIYSARVSLIEPMGTSTVRLTLSIPKELPVTGKWYFREVGIYLDTGDLFATGALNPAYEKDNQYGIKMYVACTANRLGDVVSVNVGSGSSMPLVPHVNSLVAPISSDYNMVGILDQMAEKAGDDYSTGLAVRSGPGLLHWAFLGHKRIYKGPADAVMGQSAIKLSVANGGYWLNNNEVVIVQVVTGGGAGQSRKMVYNYVTEIFTVTDMDFEDIDATSNFAIWRNSANVLPERKETIPDYMVLGHGLASWKRVSSASVAEYHTYTEQYISSTLDAQSQLSHPALKPPSDDEIVFVWCSNKLMAQNQYSLSSNIITIYGKPFGAKVDILILTKVTSTIGGLPNVFESRHTGDGVTKRFYLSIVPKSQAWIAIYINGEFVHRTEFDYNITHVILHDAPAEGDVISIMQMGIYDSTQGSAVVKRFFRTVSPGDLTVVFDDPISDKAQLQVFVDGQVYSHQDYQLTDYGLQLLKLPALAGGSSLVDLYLFIPTIALPTAPDTTVSGLDTGPQWIDPAGLEGPPNRLIPQTISEVSDGAKVQWTIPEVISKDYALVFADGELLSDVDYSWNGDTSQIILNTPVQSGLLVDIVCFVESTIDEGYEVLCSSFDVQSSTDTVYQLAPVNDPGSVIVTVNGRYAHKLLYTIDAQSRIFFQAMTAGQTITAWYFNVTPHIGFRTTMRRDKSAGSSANTYPLSQYVSRKQNVLSFVNGVKRGDSGYSLSDGMNIISLNPNDAQSSTEITCVSFNSEPPKTRLLLRSEYNASVTSFNYRKGTVLLTREDVAAVLNRDDVLNLLTAEERAVLQGGTTTPPDTGELPQAEPGNTFVTSYWTVPANVYQITVVIIGGGGSGGGAGADFLYSGRGGKRGEYLRVTLNVQPGDQFEVRLGTGGSPYLYTADGTKIYPQAGDYGTTNGAVGYIGRDGEDTIFASYVMKGGKGGLSEPATGPTYQFSDSAGEGQLGISGTGPYLGGGAAGVTGVQTSGNNTIELSSPGDPFTRTVYRTAIEGGGGNATAPGAGGGGATCTPGGDGAFGGAGANGIVYIMWN